MVANRAIDAAALALAQASSAVSAVSALLGGQKCTLGLREKASGWHATAGHDELGVDSIPGILGNRHSLCRAGPPITLRVMTSFHSTAVLTRLACPCLGKAWAAACWAWAPGLALVLHMILR